MGNYFLYSIRCHHNWGSISPCDFGQQWQQLLCGHLICKHGINAPLIAVVNTYSRRKAWMVVVKNIRRKTQTYWVPRSKCRCSQDMESISHILIHCAPARNYGYQFCYVWDGWVFLWDVTWLCITGWEIGWLLCMLIWIWWGKRNRTFEGVEESLCRLKR